MNISNLCASRESWQIANSNKHKNRGGGRHIRLRMRGWGSPNSDDWRKSLALCLLCDERPLYWNCVQVWSWKCLWNFCLSLLNSRGDWARKGRGRVSSGFCRQMAGGAAWARLPTASPPTLPAPTSSRQRVVAAAKNYVLRTQVR